jgi:NADH-quinone oxidoreductase subunit L
LLINLPGLDWLAKWLHPVLDSRVLAEGYSKTTELVFYVVDGAIAVVGVLIVGALWRSTSSPRRLEPRFLYMAWYLDWSLDRFIAQPGQQLAAFSATVVENRVIDGAVNAVASLVGWSGSVLRRLQTGYVRTYALGFAAGVVALIAYLLTRAVG